MRAHTFSMLSIVSFWGIVSGDAEATTVSVGAAEHSTGSGEGTITMIITVTADEGELVKDFHILPGSDGCILPKQGGTGGVGYVKGGGMADWLSNQVSQHGQGVHFATGQSTGTPLDGDSEEDASGTITISFPGSASDAAAINAGTLDGLMKLAWTSTDDGTFVITTSGGSGGDGNGIEDGKTGEDDRIPGRRAIKKIAQTTIGQTASYHIEYPNGAPPSGLTYKVYVSTAVVVIDNAEFADVEEPIPGSYGIGLSTNSMGGSTLLSSGCIRADSYNETTRNLVMLDVPNDPNLVGVEFDLMVEFSDGPISTVTRTTVQDSE